MLRLTLIVRAFIGSVLTNVLATVKAACDGDVFCEICHYMSAYELATRPRW